MTVMWNLATQFLAGLGITDDHRSLAELRQKALRMGKCYGPGRRGAEFLSMLGEHREPSRCIHA